MNEGVLLFSCMEIILGIYLIASSFFLIKLKKILSQSQNKMAWIANVILLMVYFALYFYLELPQNIYDQLMNKIIGGVAVFCVANTFFFKKRPLQNAWILILGSCFILVGAKKIFF